MAPSKSGIDCRLWRGLSCLSPWTLESYLDSFAALLMRDNLNSSSLSITPSVGDQKLWAVTLTTANTLYCCANLFLLIGFISTDGRAQTQEEHVETDWNSQSQTRGNARIWPWCHQTSAQECSKLRKILMCQDRNHTTWRRKLGSHSYEQKLESYRNRIWKTASFPTMESLPKLQPSRTSVFHPHNVRKWIWPFPVVNILV